MSSEATHSQKRQVNRRLFCSLLLATHVVDSISSQMNTAEHCYWQKTLLGHTLTMSHDSCVDACDTGTRTLVTALRSWLRAHEEAQVMIASILVVAGLWWLVRAVLALLINLICPIVFVVLAVVCVPQLRAPLLGQNYPLLANLVRSILMKMAENIKAS